MLKVNLIALTASAPASVIQQVKKSPSSAALEKVIAAKQATEKISMAKSAEKNKSVVAKKKQPIPKPNKREEATADKLPPILSSKNQAAVIRQARYRHKRPPVYPPRALALGQEGTVTLHAEVMPTGLPRELKVTESSGHYLLDMAALAAVKEWEFEPGGANGSMVTSWVRIPIRFVIR